MLTVSQREWLRVRSYLTDHRYDLAQSAASEYHDRSHVGSTSLLTAPAWIPTEPLPLDAIDLVFDPDVPFSGLTGTEPVTETVRPFRADGSRYPTYSAVMGDLAAPVVFENRSTYRLLEADLTGRRGRITFGRGTYFDGIDTGEAAAHEYAAVKFHEDGRGALLRGAIVNPCDPTQRPTNVAISTLTLRQDWDAGEASFLLHRRDPSQVGHAGGLYQVVPVGIFQASDDQSWNERNDFSLWRCMVREFAEELLGETEKPGSDHAPIDYDRWPFARRITRAYRNGDLRVYCLGIGVDPLTYATDLLTVVVIDAPVSDELFAGLVTQNSEGRLEQAGDRRSPAIPFTPEVVTQYIDREPMQAAGAALLALSLRTRSRLLG